MLYVHYLKLVLKTDIASFILGRPYQLNPRRVTFIKTVKLENSSGVIFREKIHKCVLFVD